MKKIQKQPPELFYRKDVLKNFAKLTYRKTSVSESLFNKVAGVKPAT